jgi:hypothetical protein
MPTTRRGAAVEAEKFASEDDVSPSPAYATQRSNEKAPATTTTAPKSKKTNTSKKALKVEGKQNQLSQSADAQPQPSTAHVEPVIGPSDTAHSSDKVDESVGGVAPKAKLPVPVSDVFVSEGTVIITCPVLY